MEKKKEKIMVPFVTDYCPYLDEKDWSDVETLDQSQIIIPGNYPYPKEGRIGYMKFENLDDEQLACMGKFRDDTGRVCNALYIDDDGRPARDKDGRLYDLMPSIGDIHPAWMDADEDEEIEVEFVNKPFDTSKVLFST